MDKKKDDKKSNIGILIIFLIFFLIIFLINFIKFKLPLILNNFFLNVDGYLISRLCYCCFWFILIIVIGIFFSNILCYEKKGKIPFKESFKKNTLSFIIMYLIFTVIEIIIIYRGVLYIKDISNGSVVAVMSDVDIEFKYYKLGMKKYISGDIDGKKIQLELTRDAFFDTNNVEIRKVRIKYYKNLKEVIEYIDIIE